MQSDFSSALTGRFLCFTVSVTAPISIAFGTEGFTPPIVQTHSCDESRQNS